jgi:hypothetical protein
MRSFNCALGIVVVAVALTGCRSKGVIRDCPHDVEFRTEQQWFDATRLPYAAPELRKERILNNVDRVGVGSTKNEVVAALGEPDYETEIRPKNPKRSCDYKFIYYFEKPGIAVNVMHDKQIEMFFSANGKATWIVGNINGVVEKGGPTKDEE